VVGLVLGHGLKLGLAGVACGLPFAFAGARLIRGLLFEVRASNPGTLVAVAAALMAVTLVASYVPARRAPRVDPLTALRAE
jgi:ABC-type antimicrobial peptide transport system permease subunit